MIAVNGQLEFCADYKSKVQKKKKEMAEAGEGGEREREKNQQR